MSNPEPDYEAIGRQYVKDQQAANDAAQKASNQAVADLRTQTLVIEAIKEDRRQQVAKARAQLRKAGGYALIGALAGFYVSIVEDFGAEP